jgi:hypothetical protein
VGGLIQVGWVFLNPSSPPLSQLVAGVFFLFIYMLVLFLCRFPLTILLGASMQGVINSVFFTIVPESLVISTFFGGFWIGVLISYWVGSK